jgi:hypothetical protein
VRDRAGHWETTLMVVNQGQGSIQGKAGGDADFKNDTGWGFSIGYNIDNHLNLAWEFSHVDPKYTTTYLDDSNTTQTLTHTSDFYTNNLNLTYHILKGSITPFVMGGIGFSYVDSNVKDGTGYCAGDSYWGWYCYANTYNSTDWAFNLAVGIRADITSNAFVRGSYGFQKLDMGSSSNKFDSSVARIEGGLRF